MQHPFYQLLMAHIFMMKHTCWNICSTTLLPLTSVVFTLCISQLAAEGLENGGFEATPFPAHESQWIQHWMHYNRPIHKVAVIKDPDPARGNVLRLAHRVQQCSNGRVLKSKCKYRLSLWVKADKAIPQVELNNIQVELRNLPTSTNLPWTKVEAIIPARKDHPVPHSRVDLRLIGKPLKAGGAVFFDDIQLRVIKNDKPTGLNQVVNGSFEAPVSLLKHPKGWWGSDHPNRGHPVFGMTGVSLDRQIRHGGNQHSPPFVQAGGDTDWTYSSEILDLRYFPEDKLTDSRRGKRNRSTSQTGRTAFRSRRSECRQRCSERKYSAVSTSGLRF